MDVRLFRGFCGEVYSTGMDKLAKKIKSEFSNFDVVIDSYENWYEHYEDLKTSDDSIVLIGHSFGALACYKIADMLKEQKRFPLVVSFDYSPYYSGIVKHTPNGIASSNVHQVINFYQEIDPLVRGVRIKREDGTENMIDNVKAPFLHAEIDKVGDFHKNVLETLDSV